MRVLIYRGQTAYKIHRIIELRMKRYRMLQPNQLHPQLPPTDIRRFMRQGKALCQYDIRSHCFNIANHLRNILFTQIVLFQQGLRTSSDSLLPVCTFHIHLDMSGKQFTKRCLVTWGYRKEMRLQIPDNILIDFILIQRADGNGIRNQCLKSLKIRIGIHTVHTAFQCFQLFTQKDAVLITQIRMQNDGFTALLLQRYR